MIRFIKHYIPKTNTRTRPGAKMTPSSITIHETDNTQVRANARAHALLQANGNPRQASWHLQVDDEPEVYQSLPFTEAAYHSGTYKGNYSSIAIEMCVNQDGNYQQTVLNTIQVINFLKAKYPTIQRVIQHHHWSRKNCPRILRSATVMSWTDFLAQTNKKTPSTSAKASPYQSTNHLFPKGSHVHLTASATRYATGEKIPNRYKNKTYTVLQRGSNRLLLKELYSWVHTKNVVALKQTAFKVGQKVRIKSSAKKYARSTKTIPKAYKNKSYTIQQVGQNDVLIKELYSWVKKDDIQ